MSRANTFAAIPGKILNIIIFFCFAMILSYFAKKNHSFIGNFLPMRSSDNRLSFGEWSMSLFSLSFS
jgi:hypothetical protein